jgi:putative FmdB family regulatory protein
VGDFFPGGICALPLYAYRCTQCGHRFEKIQNFSAEPEMECPKCHGLLERPLTAPRLHFKGAGWYVNDYAAKSSDSTSDSGSSSESTSKDAKAPAAKTESTTAAPASTSAPAPAPAAAPSSSTPSTTS